MPSSPNLLLSSIQNSHSMPGNSRFSYKKLKKDPSLYGEDEEEQDRQQQQQQQVVVQFRLQERPRSRIRLRKRWRFRVPRLRKLFKRRKFVWASWAKIVRRLKESQAHFGDLFAGNYLFLQVTPESLKVRAKAHATTAPYLNYMPSARAGW